MTRALPRALSAVLLALALSLTGCSDMRSGDSNPNNQIDQAPGVEGDDESDESDDQSDDSDDPSDEATP